MNAPLLTRRQLQNALERLAHHLHRRGVHAELYLFGGVADIIVLARLVGASSVEEVLRVAHQVYGDKPLSQRSRAVVADLDDALHEP